MGDCTSLVEETVPSLVVVCRLAQPQIQQIGAGALGAQRCRAGRSGRDPHTPQKLSGLSKALPRYNNLHFMLTLNPKFDPKRYTGKACEEYGLSSGRDRRGQP